ncbi:MAG TPA: hypothetical protein VIM73_04970 [Polyangiaceae bacterium]
MSLRQLLVSSSLSAMLLVATAASAAPASHHDGPCALAGYNVTRVAPYRIEERVGRGVLRRLAGAQLFIPAQQGLTKELVGANVTRHLREMRSTTMPGCPLDLERVSVTVSSATTGYWVQISAKDREVAKEILARAQHLVHR